MSICPPVEKWNEYVQDRLDASEDRTLTQHVETCKRCEEILAALVAPIDRARPASESYPVPPELVDDLIRLWKVDAVRYDSMDPADWPKITGFELLGPLGQGGTGVVFEARDSDLGRRVAIKLIAAGVQSSPSDVRLMENHARVAAQFRHAHIVTILSVGRIGSLPYCVMELVSGGSLAQRIEDLVRSPREAVRLVAEAARALQYAHEHGVCHRDVKPANILLRVRCSTTGGTLVSAPLSTLDACVADFGLAKRMRDGGSISLSGTVLGTPGYVAPEQIRSAKPSAAADVYGLGATLYECLTGQPPAKAATPFDTLLMTLHTDPIQPRVLNSRLDRDLETICLKCLEKDPAQRYGSAVEVAEDLERWLRGDPIRARRVSRFSRAWRWCRRRPAVASLSVALLLVSLAGIAGVGVEWRNERAARRQVEDHLATMRQLVFKLAELGKSLPTREFDAQRQQRKALLLEVELLCLRLLEAQQASPEVRLTLAQVNDELRELAMFFGDARASQRAAEEAVFHWELVAGPQAGSPTHELALARAHRQLAHACASQGDHKRAFASFRAAHSRMEPHVDGSNAMLRLEFIDLKLELAQCTIAMSNRSGALVLLDDGSAYLRDLLDKSSQSSDLRRRLANVYWSQGKLLIQSAQSVEARKSLDLARALYRQLIPESPPSSWPEFKWDLAQCCIDAAQAPGGVAADYEEAISLIEDSCRKLNRLASEDPTRAAEMLFDRYFQLAQCYRTLGKTEEALNAYATSLRHAEEGVGTNGMDSWLFKDWPLALALAAQLQRQAGRPTDVAVGIERLTAGIGRLMQIARTEPRRRANIGTSLLALSVELSHIPADDLALRAADGSRRILEELIAEAPTESTYLSRLSETWRQIGSYWRCTKNHRETLHACRQALLLAQRARASEPNISEHRVRLNECHVELEHILGKTGRREEELGSILEREKLWPGDVARLKVVAGDLRKLADKVNAGKDELTPAELAERQTYLDHSSRVERAAQRLTAEHR